ncbi:MAG: amidohydrolase [Micrococcales bacterium]
MFSFTGFRDGHCHPLFAARESDGPVLAAGLTAHQIVETLRNWLAQNPDCRWLDCGSYSPEIETPGLSAKLLDEVSRVIPIVVHRVDHHAIWVNSAALRVADLEDSAPVLRNASFDLDPSGKPTGVVREWDAMSLIYEHQPKPSLESDMEALRRAQNRLLANGIVAVQDAWIDPGMETVYLQAAATEKLNLRFNLATRIDPGSWAACLRFARGLRSDTRSIGNELLTANTVKVFLDGVFGSQTAWVSEHSCPNPRANGIWDEPELLKMALEADSAGFQLHFHCVGDEAFSQALRVAEHLEIWNGPVDRRVVIAHADIAKPGDLLMAKQMGVIVCAQPAWAADVESISEAARVLNQPKVATLYPLRSILDAGVRLSFGSDWPVSPPDPLMAIAGASHLHHNPDSALSRQEAMTAHSTAVAEQLGHEQLIGADEVILSENPTTCDLDKLQDIRVLKVTVAGRPVWDADHLSD